jgi:hypothetical protein
VSFLTLSSKKHKKIPTEVKSHNRGSISVGIQLFFTKKPCWNLSLKKPLLFESGLRHNQLAFQLKDRFFKT